MHNQAGVRYTIDARDKISLVDESWNRFANENDGAGLEGAKIIGRSLWDFIADVPTRQLYKQIIARVRQGRETRFTLRCDSPSCRRLLEMTISARPAGAIEFETRALRVEEREPVALLARTTTRSTEFLRACAWCNRIHVGSGSDPWVEVEVAMRQLLLFERDCMPQLTHGICKPCLEKMTTTLANPEPDSRAGAAPDPRPSGA